MPDFSFDINPKRPMSIGLHHTDGNTTRTWYVNRRALDELEAVLNAAKLAYDQNVGKTSDS